MTRILAALAAAVLLTCAPAAAQLDTRTIPAASPLAGNERMPAVQGSGCVSKTTPCANVAVTPSLIATFLTPTFQAKDTDLDAIAALTTTSFGRGLLTQADATAVRSAIGLGTLATQSGTFSGTSSGTNSGDQTITLTGDVTGSGTGSFAATLATVNSNIGSFGASGSLSVPTVTVNGKGLVTAAGSYALGSMAGQAASGVAITGGTASLGSLTVAGLERISGTGTFSLTSPGLLLFASNDSYKLGFDSAGGTVGNIRYHVDTADTIHGHLFSAGSVGSPSTIMYLRGDGVVIAPRLPTYASDSAAGSGGLPAGAFYKTSTGELRIKL